MSNLIIFFLGSLWPGITNSQVPIDQNRQGTALVAQHQSLSGNLSNIGQTNAVGLLLGALYHFNYNHRLGLALEVLDLGNPDYPGTEASSLTNIILHYEWLRSSKWVDTMIGISVITASRGSFAVNATSNNGELSSPFMPDSMRKDFVVSGQKHAKLDGIRLTLGLGRTFGAHSLRLEGGWFDHPLRITGGNIEAYHPNGSFVQKSGTILQRSHSWRGQIVSLSYTYLSV